jgi:hypothetical protein
MATAIKSPKLPCLLKTRPASKGVEEALLSRLLLTFALIAAFQAAESEAGLSGPRFAQLLDLRHLQTMPDKS